MSAENSFALKKANTLAISGTRATIFANLVGGSFVNDKKINRKDKEILGGELPCGCKRIRSGWTREYARTEVLDRLSVFLGYDMHSLDISEDTPFISLFKFDPKQYRNFSKLFWVECDIDIKMNTDRTFEYLIDDQDLPPLPVTLGEFISRVHNSHAGETYEACAMHYGW